MPVVQCLESQLNACRAADSLRIGVGAVLVLEAGIETVDAHLWVETAVFGESSHITQSEVDAGFLQIIGPLGGVEGVAQRDGVDLDESCILDEVVAENLVTLDVLVLLIETLDQVLT